ncbi:MAG: cobyric acid synthase [Hyphomicrobiales bacterium]
MKKKLSPIMFVGTGSDVGKSWICTGICRILLQDGHQPAPYKAQNMSLNSYATPNGLEIGRAQAVQAEACSLESDSDMNPVLMKPTSDQSAQIILNGKPIGTQTAKEYFLSPDRDQLFEEVKQAFQRLEDKYNPIVMEGAGSISELNLKHLDITNMRIAKAAKANVYIISDIDKGGVFASVYGSMMLLDEEERALVKGIIINKFRGDIELFTEGKKILEDLCKVPVVGIIPYNRDIVIEEEDSASLKNKNLNNNKGVKIGVVLLNHMSNFTDFNVLERDERIQLFYSDEPEELDKADIIIIPGTKSTITDLQIIRDKGIVKSIHKAVQENRSVIGICGGFQMLGEVINDPENIESNQAFVPGIGLLPIATNMKQEKRSVQTIFSFKNSDKQCKGYEIHMGDSKLSEDHHMNQLNDGSYEGCYLNNKLWGSYIHGIFDNQAVIDDMVAPYTQEKAVNTVSYSEFKDQQYDGLADFLRIHLDMNRIYEDM